VSGGLVCGAALVAAGSLLLGGCASARLVLVEPGGGAVVIPRNTPKSREKAYALMARQCPRGFHIVREEEVLVGSTVTREYETEFDRIREEVRTTEEERVRRNVEWRITFSCR
jgi:hypothetical protein